MRANTLDLPAGSIRADRGELILRSLGKRYEAAELADIPIANTPRLMTMLQSLPT